MENKRLFLIYTVVFSFILFLLSCQQNTTVEITGSTQFFPIDTTGGKIRIVDQTEKAWDITHAVKTYRFDPEKFQYGLGINYRPAITDPQFISPGENGYPPPTVTQIIFASGINNVFKAYPIFIMKTYEVANDRFGDSYVAATY
jgi:hypothetical protein